MKSSRVEKRLPCGKLKHLSPAQLASLEEWGSQLSAKKACERCAKEFHIRISLETMRKLQRDCRQKTKTTEIDQHRRQLEELVAELTSDPGQPVQTFVARGGKIAFDLMLKQKDDSGVTLLRELARLLIAARKDDRDQEKFLLSREQWEFDVSRRCWEHFHELQEIFADDSVEEDQRLFNIRKRLFGDNLPD